MSHMEHLKHLKIPLETINNCTQNFNKTNLIGKGGYGKVYKGILSWADIKNQPVAVKRLDDTGCQGKKEFYTEITMLSQYRHDNIITLVGFCDDDNEMILVYEYATHGSLDTYLTDDGIKLDQLSWKIRLNICVGIASALDYLHNHVAAEHSHRVIHRDMKSGNILLDEKLNPKLSDFGLSRIGLANPHNSVLFTNVAGTYGYCDPEYRRTGILTKESDVYSFGVVLFEVLCGRLACVDKYHDEKRFLDNLVRTYYGKGELQKIVDYRIMNHIKSTTMTKFSAIAYQCIQETRQQRPAIAEVLRMLREIQFERAVIGTSSNRTESSSTGSASPVIESTSGSPNTDHVDDNYIQPPLMNDGVTSDVVEEDDPGIEDFQIIGDAKPGGKLLACGFPFGGTSLVMFQWVRYLQDQGQFSLEYIEGATNPEYVVTADDVDKFITVECIPIDDQGREGEIVRLFANEQNKITCDPIMQQEIDKYISAGEASFSLLLRMDTETWEQTTFSLRRPNYQIKINRTQYIFIEEKYSSDISIKIPSGLTSQFVLTRPNGFAHYFNTFNDIRLRDIIVLTMRAFQKKVNESDGNGKGMQFRTKVQRIKQPRFKGAADDDPLPAVESLQISGEAFPSRELQACGYSLNGTTSCSFKWVRHIEDGSGNYIEGAMQPNYLVTADDVDTYLAIEVQPMDNRNQKGELVKVFANEHRKIVCDPIMQQEIDKYISAGEASFSLLLRIDFSETTWEQTTFSLRRSNYQIKINRTQDIFIEEKYSSDISIKISSGHHTSEFVLTRPNGFAHYFSTSHDFRLREIIVLTMRTFQKKALDGTEEGRQKHETYYS